MGTTTMWALRTWAKLTVLLVLIVAGSWLHFGTHSGWFWIVTGLSVLAEYYVVRQLAREWSWEARSTWWWSA